MSGRRFFVLQQPIAAAEIESFLCRVVRSKTSPLDEFAPFPSTGTPPHKTSDIIPTILPEPNKSTSFKEVLTCTRNRRIGNQLSGLLKIDLSIEEEQSTTLECEELKRYSLPNLHSCFQQLMMNEHYAKDVRALLEKAWPRHTYLVTGFITATNSHWKIDSKRKGGNGVDVMVPVAQMGGLSLPGFLNTRAGAERSSEIKQYREMKVEGEEIIAVSYSTAKLSYHFDSTINFASRIPTIGHAKRAKPNHLAMGDFDDEFIDWESDDDSEILAEKLGSTRAISDREPVGIKLEDSVELLSDDYEDLWIELF